MAPTPTDDPTLNPDATSTSTPSARSDTYWSPANIAFTAVLASLFFAILALMVTFYIRRRSTKRSHASLHAAASHPDKASLLAGDEESGSHRSSMFSRHRGSSVTLYVDERHETEDIGHRVSRDSAGLVPLHISPSSSHTTTQSTSIPPMTEPSTAQPDDTTSESHGSGVSSLSAYSHSSGGTRSTMVLSPLTPTAIRGDEGDAGVRAGRVRSTSTASMKRYYDSVAPGGGERPPVPTIVRTESD